MGRGQQHGDRAGLQGEEGQLRGPQRQRHRRLHPRLARAGRARPCSSSTTTTGARASCRSASRTSPTSPSSRTRRASRHCCRARSTSCRTCRCRTSTRLEKTQDLKVNLGPENRSIFLGMDVGSPELKSSDVKGKNPFADKRVRQAINIGHRPRGHQARGDARSVGAGRHDRAAVRQRLHEGARTPPPRSTSTRPRSCWRRPAIRTASRSPCTAPTTATSRTKASARRSLPCWRASASR